MCCQAVRYRWALLPVPAPARSRLRWSFRTRPTITGRFESEETRPGARLTGRGHGHPGAKRSVPRFAIHDDARGPQCPFRSRQLFRLAATAVTRCASHRHPLPSAVLRFLRLFHSRRSQESRQSTVDSAGTREGWESPPEGRLAAKYPGRWRGSDKTTTRTPPQLSKSLSSCQLSTLFPQSSALSALLPCLPLRARCASVVNCLLLCALCVLCSSLPSSLLSLRFPTLNPRPSTIFPLLTIDSPPTLDFLPASAPSTRTPAPATGRT